MEAKDSNSFYHSQKGYSSTQLKNGIESMAHYKAAKGVKLRSEALTFGSLLHCVYLEPEKLEEDFIIYDPEDRPNKKAKGGKANEAWINELQNEAELSGKEGAVSFQEVAKAKAMKKSAFKNPYVFMLFNHPDRIVEQSTYQKMNVKNIKNGHIKEIEVRARPDLEIKDLDLILDIKTVGIKGGASVDEFSRIADKRNYELSAAYYIDIRNLEQKEQGQKQIEYQFVWFAQEKEEPYNYNLIFATADHIAQGRVDYQILLENIVTSEYMRNWPCYPGYSEIMGCMANAPAKWRKRPKPLNIETIDWIEENKLNIKE